MPNTHRKFLCHNCREEKPASDFHKDRDSKTGVRRICKPCVKPLNRKRKLFRRYGLTIEEFTKKLDKQKWKCACCGVQLVLEGRRADIACVDHNHRTGQIRDILCGRCNLAAGMVRDCSIRAGKLKRYLQKWNC